LRVPEEALECRVAELESRVKMLGLEFRKLRQSVASGAMEDHTGNFTVSVNE